MNTMFLFITIYGYMYVQLKPRTHYSKILVLSIYYLKKIRKILYWVNRKAKVSLLKLSFMKGTFGNEQKFVYGSNYYRVLLIYLYIYIFTVV